jgi:UDP-glucose 4-epimerase
MRVLVTGGAGYIGAHTSLLLAERGDYVFIVDDLVTGSVERVPGIPLLQLDLTSDGARGVIAALLREHEIDAVIHFAARKQVAESLAKPAWYYQQNVGGLAQLLMAMDDASVGKLVFSSSAAVYGQANGLIDEMHDTRPVSPYGETKLACEQLISASVQAQGLSAVSLRYFNVGGAGRSELGDTEALNLIPIVLENLIAGKSPAIFGDDYDTPDGTCVRDYVHVVDVAEAHLAVLDSLEDQPNHRILNIGTGIGTSVRDMVSSLIAVAGSSVGATVHPRRPGDAASVVAIVDRIRTQTGWKARFGLDEIVRSAWESRQHFAK